MGSVFPGVQSLCACLSDFIGKNDPAKVVRRVGDPELEISDQSASVPSMVCILCPNRSTRADRRREITANRSPSARAVEGMNPSGVSRSRLSSRAAWCAGIRGAFTPITQHPVQGKINVCGVRTGL